MAQTSTKTNDRSQIAISALYAGSISLTAFWIVIILKTAYTPVTNFLNWYDPVGPLLGTFGVGLIAFFVTGYLAVSWLKAQNDTALAAHEKRATTLFVIAVVLVFFMTFPPLFEPIADLLH